MKENENRNNNEKNDFSHSSKDNFLVSLPFM